MAGNSGLVPPSPSENCFVVDEESGLDATHQITKSQRIVEVSLPTTRYVGTVDSEGFLTYGAAAVKAGRLAGTMRLTVRARISGFDLGGILGWDGLDVEVYLHRGETGHERSLGTLEGDFGINWENFTFDVNTVDLKFPDDPCPKQSPTTWCDQAPLTRWNKLSFVFSGTHRLSLEIDWMALETKGGVGLASRPVLLLHGWGQSAAAMGQGTAWADELTARDIPWYADQLPPTGWFWGNADEVAVAITDMRRRFGVDRVNVVGFGKGGVDARYYTAGGNGVDSLIMLGSPNGGCFLSDVASVPLYWGWYLDYAGLEMTDWGTYRLINKYFTPNPKVLYVTISASYDSLWAQAVAKAWGPNDEVVTTGSVARTYAVNEPPYLTSVTDAESQGICASQGLSNHNCLRYNQVIAANEIPLFLDPPDSPLRPGQVPLRRPRIGEKGAGPAEPASEDGMQGIGSQVAPVPQAGVTDRQSILIDAVDNALFYAFADGGLLSLGLVSPSGTRIDAATPSTDSTVAHSPLHDAEVCWYTAYQIRDPEPGTWTLEVTGTAVPAEGNQYAIVALTQLPPGTGVSLSVTSDRESYVSGDELVIVATLASGVTPVTGATVTAQTLEPDGTITTPIALPAAATPDGGQYRGSVGAPELPGLYSIVVSAAGTNPDFTRQGLVQVLVAPSATAFSGGVSDHGADTDGDGRYDQLAIEVGLDVDTAATYRVPATLAAPDGTVIQQVQVVEALTPGSQTVSLLFDGARLFDLGLDGPYILDGLVIEDVETSTTLASGSPYTTAAYSHDEFERPMCLLTGNTSDHGLNTDPGDRVPYEALVIDVEIDTLAGANVWAVAQLYAEDGTFITTGRTYSSLFAGPNTLEFRIPATQIYRVGKAGPYNLQLFSMWEASAQNTSLSMNAPDVIATTQPYALEDFAPSPLYLIGGTVTGLEGEGLQLEDLASYAFAEPGNGSFAFTQPVSIGNAYDVQVVMQPNNPMQVCSITNGKGTVGAGGVTDIVVECVTTVPEAGLDPDFGSAGKVAAKGERAIALGLQSDGGIVLLGDHTLTRYDGGGNLDTTFGTEGVVSQVLGSGYFAVAKSLAVQPDGKILVCGYTTVDPQNTQYDFALARYTAGGILDPDFGGGEVVTTDFAGGYDEGCSVLVNDGGIVVAGLAVSDGPIRESQVGIARYTPDGYPDPNFGNGTGKVSIAIPGGTGSASWAALQADGRIVVLGLMTLGYDVETYGLLRYTPDGALDPLFGTGGLAQIAFVAQPTGLAVQGDGAIVVVGWVTGTPDAFVVARFDTSGNPDLEFGNGGLVTTTFGDQAAWAQAVAIQDDGRIVVAGQTVYEWGDRSDLANEDFAVARYLPGGVPDDSFGTGGQETFDFFAQSDQAQCVAVQPDGKILVAGSASEGLGLLRLLP